MVDVSLPYILTEWFAECWMLLLCLQLVDMVISDYQPVIDDLMSAARDLTQVISKDSEVELSVSYIVEKFNAIKQSIHQQRQSLDLLLCISSEDVSHVTLLSLVLIDNFARLLFQFLLSQCLFIFQYRIIDKL